MTRYVPNLDPNDITETRNLSKEPFKPEDPLSVGTAWEQWLQEIEREVRFFKINTAEDKKDALLIFGGREIAHLGKSLPEPDGKLDDYQKLRKKLSEYFFAKKKQVSRAMRKCV